VRFQQDRLEKQDLQIGKLKLKLQSTKVESLKITKVTFFEGKSSPRKPQFEVKRRIWRDNDQNRLRPARNWKQQVSNLARGKKQGDDPGSLNDLSFLDLLFRQKWRQGDSTTLFWSAKQIWQLLSNSKVNLNPSA
jgi:hypothetical protein